MATDRPEAWLGRRVIASGPSPLEAAQLDRRAPGAAAGAFHFLCRRKLLRTFGEDPQDELAPVIHARRAAKTLSKSRSPTVPKRRSIVLRRPSEMKIQASASGSRSCLIPPAAWALLILPAT